MNRYLCFLHVCVIYQMLQKESNKENASEKLKQIN